MNPGLLNGAGGPIAADEGGECFGCCALLRSGVGKMTPPSPQAAPHGIPPDAYVGLGAAATNGAAVVVLFHYVDDVPVVELEVEHQQM